MSTLDEAVAALRSRIEGDLFELAGLLEPDEVLEYLGRLVERMRGELEEGS